MRISMQLFENQCTQWKTDENKDDPQIRSDFDDQDKDEKEGSIQIFQDDHNGFGSAVNSRPLFYGELDQSLTTSFQPDDTHVQLDDF